MNSETPKHSNSDQVDRVICDYLDEMLCEPEVEDVNKEALSRLLARSVFLREDISVLTEETPLEKPAVEPAPTQVAKPVISKPFPDWAAGSFECLIFNVAGLKMAVPLIMLGAVFEVDKKFHSLPGQQDWFLGILQTTNAGNIKVLDTASYIMPERYKNTLTNDAKYVITIYGRSWGLACHSVEQSLRLRPDQVKWRSERGKRPWLAGTVVDHMCSLVDTEGFQKIIEQCEQHISPSIPVN